MNKLINSILAWEGETVPSEHAKLLIQTYKREEGGDPMKTRSVWFSVPDLGDIVKLASKLVNGKQCNGIRVYFGKYPANDDVIKPPNNDYLGRVTVVFVPTYDETTGNGLKHIDIFNVDAAVKDGEGEGFNHGELCPPSTSCP